MIVFSFLSGMALVLSMQGSQQAAEQSMSIAESEHEIVMMLISQESYDEAVVECKKLFSVKLPPGEESRFLDSAKTISGALVRHGQHELATRVLDEAIDGVKDRDRVVLAGLYKEKALIYKKMGKMDEAMELFKKAIALEKMGNSQD